VHPSSSWTFSVTIWNGEQEQFTETMKPITRPTRKEWTLIMQACLTFTITGWINRQMLHPWTILNNSPLLDWISMNILTSPLLLIRAMIVRNSISFRTIFVMSHMTILRENILLALRRICLCSMISMDLNLGLLIDAFIPSWLYLCYHGFRESALLSNPKE